MQIDCGQCVMQHTDACKDCVVTFLLDKPGGAVVFDLVEERAIRTLQVAGLAPRSRFSPRPSAAASGRPSKPSRQVNQ